MATLVAAVPSTAAMDALSSAAFAGAAGVAPVHPGSSPAAAGARLRRHRLLPLVHLSPPRRALPSSSPGRLRLVAAFSPSIAPVTKMTSTAAGAAASWAAAVFTPAPHAAAAPPSLSAIAISVARMFLELARAVAERLGADLSAPWTAAVSGAGRCLELYREIMLVRCLLTWFPNVPWERQPFSAMRDLCDPFLRFFQRIVPPVFGNTLDISSLLAFTALGVLARLMSLPSPTAF